MAVLGTVVHHGSMCSQVIDVSPVVQARRLPKEMLMAVVRGRFEVRMSAGDRLRRCLPCQRCPNVRRHALLVAVDNLTPPAAHSQALEYPASLERLYQMSPDEAIPEFFSDAAVFESVHPDMPDLQLPGWAANAADFVQRHRWTVALLSTGQGCSVHPSGVPTMTWDDHVTICVSDRISEFQHQSCAGQLSKAVACRRACTTGST